jgi:hypothetical protein
MNDDAPDARPVPVPPAVHDLIRQVAPERGAAANLERSFTLEGREWVARIAGEGVGGTGARGGAYLVAVQFHPAGDGAEGDREDSPREALLPRGRFELLYEEELRELFRTARPLPRQSRG